MPSNPRNSPRYRGLQQRKSSAKKGLTHQLWVLGTNITYRTLGIGKSSTHKCFLMVYVSSQEGRWLFFPLFFLQSEAKPPGKTFLCRADAFLGRAYPLRWNNGSFFLKRHKPLLLKALSLAKPTNVFTCNHGSTKCNNISYPLYIHIQHTSVSGLLRG